MKCSKCGEHTAIWVGSTSNPDAMYVLCVNCGARNSQIRTSSSSKDKGPKRDREVAYKGIPVRRLAFSRR